MSIHPEAESLILRFEGGNETLEWPEGQSGVTAACGYDFGYHTPKEIDADWNGRVSADTLATLVRLAGITGESAARVVRRPDVAAVRIPYEVSRAVFDERTLPKFLAETLRAFPGADQLPALSFGALVSLVYNRGASVDPANSRRQEMVAIRRFVAVSGTWPLIPREIAAMVRLWPETPTASNLPGRRLAEAALFAKGLRDAGMVDARTLLQGDKGPAVEVLQKELVAVRAVLSVDGDYGVKTRHAVWRFQLAMGLPKTGIADAQTLGRLALI